jgi:hypothetical protein
MIIGKRSRRIGAASTGIHPRQCDYGCGVLRSFLQQIDFIQYMGWHSNCYT